jgi:para-nitrobenzyl esterase
MDIGFSHATTIDELFSAFGSKASAARGAYDPNGTGDPRSLSMTVAADRMMVEPARFVARTLSSEGQPVWVYRFSYVATSVRKEWPGAPHASEIPFVFDTVKARYGAALTYEDEKVAQAIHAHWLQFVKCGDPNGPASHSGRVTPLRRMS